MASENQNRDRNGEIEFDIGVSLLSSGVKDLALRTPLAVGGGLSGAVGGAGAGTALGFAVGGPAGAAVGFMWGFYGGLGAGFTAGWKGARWLNRNS